MKLTKSDFLKFIESPLHLWAAKNDKLDPHTPDLYAQHLSRQGYEVEELAKKFLRQKVTQEYPKATLSFQETLVDGDYECRIDALVHDKIYDTYDLYEIKSSSSIKTDHEYDVTFQCLIGQSQLNLHKIYLVHLNSEYKKDGDIDLFSLFAVDDMMEVVTKRQEKVLAWRQEALDILKLPDPPLDGRCHKPKECRCLSLCHPNLDEYSIYDLYNGRKGKYDKLLDQGINCLKDIPDNFSLTDFQKVQVKSIKTNQPMIDRSALQKELGKLVFPLYFLDYETFGMAIPIYDGYSPYQHITFQYSIHVLESDGDEPKHYEYLATETDEPSVEFLKRLCSVIGDTGSVIVWNKNFECPRNREMASLQPKFAKQLENINSRVYDLLDPFRKGYYVDYRFHGSNSIKDVLPVLVPELSYKDLDIQEGTAAMLAWYKITHDSNSAFDSDSIHLKAEIKQNLLKYCELDTLAMVEIWKKLLEHR